MSTVTMIGNFYPAFVAEVNARTHTFTWFRSREFFFFLYCALVLFFTMIEIDLINRERNEGVHGNQMNDLFVLPNENVGVVGAAHPHLPPPSYEVVCADKDACPIIPEVYSVSTPSCHSELPPSYAEVMKRRMEGAHIHHHHEHTTIQRLIF
ncbi:hypothetical protein PMAYCL1PPCAC_30336 [Pristionchus mayeri]|uniref:Uncharacterized protein n=1 Tax=Pristionchus mayeri TaxID=1317129 RepID=A0AAN5DAX2_9BILA|nr:hypothetical protein PMAYCL1PPCAC_30336 [Pristionchus mayeri]